MDRHDPAMRRFWLLQAVRITGVALAMLGALILAGRIAQSPAVGTALLVIGAVDFLILPMVLAKRWKSDR